MQYRRLEHYQQRRKRRTLAKRAAAVVSAVVVLSVGAFVGWRAIGQSHAEPALRQQQAQASTVPSRPAVSAPATSTTPTAKSSPAAVATTTAVSAPETGKRAAAGAKIVADAAVKFPDAPSVSRSAQTITELRPRHKYIAFTLDDGYNFQPEMLELLKQYDARCTTFLIGSWAASHKRDVKRMHQAGFEVANHTWSHPFLTRMSSSQIESELTRTQRVITSITGNQAPYMRPPYGDTDAGVRRTAAGLGYRVVLWNRSFGDSGRGATAKKLYKNVMTAHGGVKSGDIILCHWGSKGTYGALKRILPELKDQGFEFVTVSELIKDSKSK
jgi:peptidoglycan-N-acetylglucosamine deacetylase